MAAEPPSALLFRAAKSRYIEGFQICREALAITHIQFVDDTIFFSSPYMEEIVTLKRILRCFELSFELKINLTKSVMVSVGCSHEALQLLASVFRCKASKLPLMYIGLPLGAHSRSKAVWNSVVDSFARKLSTWKRNYLSFRGRIALIKFTLPNLSVYYMSLLLMLIVVREKLDHQ